MTIELQDVAFSESAPFAPAPEADSWTPTTLPFEAHAALHAAGRITHPYRDDAADTFGWVGERSWWLRGRFHVDNAETTDAAPALRLEGLDTVGSVWLNGVLLGSHANVFRPAIFPVEGALKPGENELLVRIDPPLEGLEVPQDSVETAQRIAATMGRAPRDDGHGMFGDLRMLRRRKPIVNWGWDFAPRLTSVGLAAAEIIDAGLDDGCGRGHTIESLGFRTTSVDLTAHTAEVVVTVVAPRAAASVVAVELTAPDGTEFHARAELDAEGRADIPLHVTDARLWFPRELGDQPLYRLTARVDGVTATQRVGIRLILLDRSPDGEGGRHFRFIVNGEPIFARGASVVPPDQLRPDPQRDRALVSLAADAGMNMIRVWGGGGYGSDALYEAADEHGVLIWQDFAFACADYPEDDELAADIRAEAVFQAQRLGAHPSLALWCGNNEVHAFHQAGRGDLGPGPWGYAYFHDILPAVVARETPGTAYWPGSPFSDADPAGVNGTHDGDRHAWEVWHGLPFGAPSPETYTSFGEAAHFRRYRYDTGRFISEFGIIAAPARDTLATWISPDELRADSAVLRSHIRDEPKDKALALLAIETGLPRDLDEYILFTQALQAEGLKYGIEHYRRQEPHTTGTLVWQLNDPWPGVSWSLIDYELRQKAAYHHVRRAFAPVAASFQHTDDGCLELWVANSTPHDVPLSLDVRIAGLDGVDLHRETVVAAAAPHTAARVWSLPAGTVAFTPEIVAWVREAERRVPGNRLYFAPLRDIPFPDPEFDHETRVDDAGQLQVTVTARSHLHGVTVTVPDASATFDDNALDLAPGESATITVTGVGDLHGPVIVEAIPPHAGAAATAPL